jgi:hypothetical protein
VSGPGISGAPRVTTTSYTVAAAPVGANVYRVGSVFDPGGLQTPSAAFSSVTANVPPPPPTCACTRTGGFAAPQLKTVSASGLTGTFTHPTYGAFRVEARSVNGNVYLDVWDPGNRSVFSETNPAAWGTSPDGAFFAVAMPPLPPSGSDIRVFRVGPGPAKMPVVLNTVAMADGRWGFSAEASMFIVTRLQNAPLRFSFEAFNLWAPNPASAALRIDQGDPQGSVSTSPCGDRLMYTHWQPSSAQSRGALFYRRAYFPVNGSPIADDDGSGGALGASVVAGPGTLNFLVQLSGLKVRGTNQTSFPSLQCSP